MAHLMIATDKVAHARVVLRSVAVGRKDGMHKAECGSDRMNLRFMNMLKHAAE